YGFHARREAEERKSTLQGIDIRDPTPRMGNICSALWDFSIPGKKQVGKRAWDSLRREPTMQGHLERIYPSGGEWTPDNDRVARSFIEDFGAIAPHSEIATRIAIQTAKEPARQQLAEWEQKLKEDSIAYLLL